MRFFVFLALCVLSAAHAQAGILRGGEHGDFTRITLDMGRAVDAVEVRVLDERKVRVTLTPAPFRLDKTQLFSRLSSDRLVDVVLIDGVVEFQLGCDCFVEHAIYGDALFALDIHDQRGMHPASVHQKIPAVTGFPFLNSDAPVLSGVRLDPLSIFGFDSGLRDRLAMTPDLPKTAMRSSDFQRGRDYAAGEMNTVITGAPADGVVCRDIQAIELIRSAIRLSGAEAPEVRQTDDRSGTRAPEEAELGFALALMQEGYFEEAKAVFAAGVVSADDGPNRSASAGSSDDPSPRHADVDCADLAVLADVVRLLSLREDQTAGDKVKLATAFMSLSPGVQIKLGRAFLHSVGDGFGGFEALRAHFRNEDARVFQQGRRDTGSGSASGGLGTDGWAATEIELRDTALHRDAWAATFERYLEDRRFFDATRHVLGATTFPNPEVVRSGATLLERIAEADDEIVLSEVLAMLENDLAPEVFSKTIALARSGSRTDGDPLQRALAFGPDAPEAIVDLVGETIETEDRVASDAQPAAKGINDPIAGSGEPDIIKAREPAPGALVSVIEASKVLDASRQTSEALMEAFGQ